MLRNRGLEIYERRKERARDKQTETERQLDRETDRQKERAREKQTKTERPPDRLAGRGRLLKPK